MFVMVGIRPARTRSASANPIYAGGHYNARQSRSHLCWHATTLPTSANNTYIGGLVKTPQTAMISYSVIL